MSPRDTSIGDVRCRKTKKQVQALSVCNLPANRPNSTDRTWKEGRKSLLSFHLGAFLLLSFGIFAIALAQQGQRQDFGSCGLFSYVPPNGWTVSKLPGMKFKICHDKPHNGFAANIVVIDEAYNKPLDEYAKDNIANMRKFFRGFTVLGQTDFMTSDNIRAVKVSVERDDARTGKRLRQIFYLFDAGNKKLVATCSRLAEVGDAFDGLFEAAMKTFSVGKEPD